MYEIDIQTNNTMDFELVIYVKPMEMTLTSSSIITEFFFRFVAFMVGLVETGEINIAREKTNAN